MIDRNKLSGKLLEKYEEFEPRYAKGIANSVALYMLGAVPLIIASAVATQKIVELSIEKRKFKTK
ncbi:MAG: hypothetical protein R3Y09_07185 [Clostridia bacterium]